MNLPCIHHKLCDIYALINFIAHQVNQIQILKKKKKKEIKVCSPLRFSHTSGWLKPFCPLVYLMNLIPGMGNLRIYPEFGIFFLFFFFCGKKPEPGKLTIFLSGKKMAVWPDTIADLPGMSRFFSTNLEVTRLPDFTCENPRFLFCFQIGKTKRRLTLSHVPCL